RRVERLLEVRAVGPGAAAGLAAMLAGVELCARAKVCDPRCALDHVEEEWAAHGRRRRLRRIPEDIGDDLPLDRALVIIADRPARVYRGDGIHRFLRTAQPACA